MGQIGRPEMSVPANKRCAISHKSKDFIYIASRRLQTYTVSDMLPVMVLFCLQRHLE